MRTRTALSLGGILVLSGCNLYGGIDKPSGDAQDLSKAEACFDTGDLTCAQQYYSEVSGSDADQATSEDAFVTLDQNGASMGTFMEFVGNISSNGTGSAITSFAGAMMPGSETKRMAVWGALAKTGSISSSSLRNFTQFITATALVGEILAEASSNGTSLKATDLVADPTTCGAAGTNCATSAACLIRSGGLTNDPTDQNKQMSASQSPSTGSVATLDDLYGALQLAVSGLTGLSASGKFSGAVSSFSNITGFSSNSNLSAAKAVSGFVEEPSGGFTPGSNSPVGSGTANTALGQCFAQILIQQGIGGK